MTATGEVTRSTNGCGPVQAPGFLSRWVLWQARAMPAIFEALVSARVERLLPPPLGGFPCGDEYLLLVSRASRWLMISSRVRHTGRSSLRAYNAS